MFQLKTKPIYVEIPIKTSMDTLWDASQKPEMHEQWDLRFSSITYLPKVEGKPQKFTYSRTVGPVIIEGWGKSVGSFHKEDGSRSSSLHFGTDHPLSPIREGKGFWKYEPMEDDVKFLTQYDYEPSFGRFGKLFDKILFRPAIGWATALSFDVLKRWLEKGEMPAFQYFRFFTTSILSLLFAFIWFYHGLIPKIIGMHPEEKAMIGQAFPFSEAGITGIVLLIGFLEVLFGLSWLLIRRKRALFLLQLLLFPLLTIVAIVTSPASVLHPFNPITLNVALIVLSGIGLVISQDIPTATSCKRKK